jgi:hypothetical protein
VVEQAHTKNCALPRLVWFFKGMLHSSVFRDKAPQMVGQVRG